MELMELAYQRDSVEGKPNSLIEAFELLTLAIQAFAQVS